MLEKELYIEIDRPNYTPIYSVQYDYNSRFYNITILNQSKPLDLTGLRVVVAGKKPDGEDIFNTCKILDAKKGQIQLELTEQMNAVAGVSEYALELFSSNGMLSSQPFQLKVTKSAISKDVTSSSELSELKNALNEVQRFEGKIDELQEHITGGNMQQEHSHTNKSILDKFSQTDGNLLFDNKEIGNQIDDSKTDISRTWSSSKIVSHIPVSATHFTNDIFGFMNDGVNLLDYNGIGVNQVASENGGTIATGGISVTNLMPVLPGIKLIGYKSHTSHVGYGKWYGRDKKTLRSINTSDFLTDVFPMKVKVPDDAFYVRFNFVREDLTAKSMIIVGDEYPSEYVENSIILSDIFKINGSNIFGLDFKQFGLDCVNADNLGDVINKFENGINLFDLDTSKEGYIIKNGSELAMGSYVCSDFIRVKPNLHITGFAGVSASNGSFFDAEKKHIRDIVDSDYVTKTYPCTVRMPDNCHYIRTHFNKSIQNPQLIIGDDYDVNRKKDYGYMIPKIFNTGGKIDTWTCDKTLYAFGDSITVGTNGSYIKTMQDKLKCSVHNFAVRGMYTSEMVKKIMSDDIDYSVCDIVTIMIGTNGTINERDTDCSGIPVKSIFDLPFNHNEKLIATEEEYWSLFPSNYAGLLGKAIEYIKYKNDKIKIYLITPPHCAKTESMSNIKKTMLEIGTIFGVKVINVQDNTGMGSRYVNHYTTDTTHINELMNQIVGEYVANQILSH